MDEKKVRNRLDYAFFTASVLGGIACAYATKNGLDLTGLSESIKIGATMGTALASSFVLQVASIKPENKIISYLKKNEKKRRSNFILDEAKKNPDKFKIIEIDRDLLSHMRESFKSKDSCMEIEAFGKNNTYLHIWSSSCKVIDNPEKNKVSIVVSVDNSTSVKLSMNSDKSYLSDLVDKPTMEIRMENMEDKNLFLSKVDSLVKGFHRAEFPSDKSIPTSNFVSPAEQENVSKREPFSLSNKEKDYSNTASLKMSKDNEKGKPNGISDGFSK